MCELLYFHCLQGTVRGCAFVNGNWWLFLDCFMNSTSVAGTGIDEEGKREMNK